MTAALRLEHAPELCPACGGDCCESCAGIGTHDAYLGTLYAAQQAVQDEMRRQRAEALVWQVLERTGNPGFDLDRMQGDLAEALELLGGE